MNEIWILGATGRSGRAIAAELTGARLPIVLVGRDTIRLRKVAVALDRDLRIVTADSVDAIVGELSRARPAVVVNTIGPFSETAPPIARACLPSTHYVDISNELFSVVALLELHDEAASASRTFVTGAGFGVLATESIVLKLCEGQPPAASVRVDAMATVEPEAGHMGTALAATIVDVLAAGGRRYEHGQLVRSRLLSDLESLTLPDGSCVKTAAGPSGELEAARRASGASFAVAASSMVPASPMLRAVLPTVSSLLRIMALRKLAVRQVAGIEFKPKQQSEAKAQERRREFSWAHARVQWASGESSEGWLRTGDAHVFATNVAVEVAKRLARDQGRSGAYTPGALFGPDLAIDAGGQFFLDHALTRTRQSSTRLERA